MRLTAITVLVAALAVPAPSAQAAGGTCQGRPATIVQSEGIVEGTDGDDVIVGGKETKVRAREGDDTICVTGGRVDGGEGRDYVEMVGGDGADFVFLRRVEDTDVAMGSGPDHARILWPDDIVGPGTIDGGPGLDILSAVAPEALFVDLEDSTMEVNGILGGRMTVTGLENIDGEAPNTVMWGDVNDNRMSGTGCRVLIFGGRGDDSIHVARGDGPASRSCNERGWAIYGQRGADRMYGGPEDDRLLGGPGRDHASGSGGRDRCDAEQEKSCER